MAITVTPVTAADATFSSSGSAAWAAGMTISQATARLLGRATAGAGVTEEITLGTNLSFTGTTLNAASGSSTWDTIGAAAGSATTANGTNNIVYNTAPTADSKDAWTFGETSAATNGTITSGIPNQNLLRISTLAASTQSPLRVDVRGNHVFSVSSTTRQIIATDGVQTAPTYSFASSLATGMYSTGGDIRFVAANGVQLMALGAIANKILVAGNSATPALSDLSNANTGINWPATNVVSFTNSTFGEMARFTGGANTALFALSAMLFANLGTPANGSFAYCSDCDAPTLVDSTCTSAGGKTGSFAARVNGAWKCFT